MRSSRHFNFVLTILQKTRAARERRARPPCNIPSISLCNARLRNLLHQHRARAFSSIFPPVEFFRRYSVGLHRGCVPFLLRILFFYRIPVIIVNRVRLHLPTSGRKGYVHARPRCATVPERCCRRRKRTFISRDSAAPPFGIFDRPSASRGRNLRFSGK